MTVSHSHDSSFFIYQKSFYLQITRNCQRLIPQSQFENCAVSLDWSIPIESDLGGSIRAVFSSVCVFFFALHFNW